MINSANIKSVKAGNYKIYLFRTQKGNPAAQIFWIVQKGPRKGQLESCDARSFGDDEKRIQWIADKVKTINETIARKAEERKVNKTESFENPYKVGHIFYASWGYEQTNVNFYEVVAATAKSVTVREIAAEIVSTEQGGYAGTKRPVAGRFIGEMQRKVVTCRVYSNGVVYSVKGISDYDKGDRGVCFSSYH